VDFLLIGFIITQTKVELYLNIMANKKSKKPSKASAKKLQKLEQVNGKIEGSNTINETKELEAVLGITEVNPFGTSSANVFEDQLGVMNLTDMQRLAVRVGVMPSSNRTTLKNKLKRKFKAQSRSVEDIAPSDESLFCQEKPIMDLSTPEGRKAAKMMREGL
jgi:hypothetical protein